MASIIFGVGDAFIRDAAGNALKFGILQDVSLDLAGSTKALYGSGRFPVDVAQTEVKISGKIKHATVDGKVLATVLGGTTAASRSLEFTVTSSGTTVVMPTPFGVDLGVIDASGNPMSLTSSAPGTGSYSRTAQTYTLNSADATGSSVYSTFTTGSGFTVSVAQSNMGAAPTYELHLYESYKGEAFGVRLYAAVLPKLSLAFKNTDFVMSDLDYECFTNAAGKCYDLYYE